MNKKRATQGEEDKPREVISSGRIKILKLFGEEPKPPPMNKKLAHEFAKKKLKEIVSSGRERIMNLLEEDEHGFISQEGEEYVYMTIKKEVELVKNGEDKPTSWDPLGEIKHQFKVGASYTDEETKEVISVWIGVDDGGLSALKPICRSVNLNANDLSICGSVL